MYLLLWIYIPSSPDLWPPSDCQGSTFCTTSVVVPNKLHMRTEVCKCHEILSVNIWPARKWSVEKRGASKSSSSTHNHTRSHTLYLTVTGMSKSSWKNKEEEVDSLWTEILKPTHLFPVLLCRRKQGPWTICNFLSEERKKNYINMQIQPDMWQQLS